MSKRMVERGRLCCLLRAVPFDQCFSQEKKERLYFPVRRPTFFLFCDQATATSPKTATLPGTVSHDLSRLPGPRRPLSFASSTGKVSSGSADVAQEGNPEVSVEEEEEDLPSEFEQTPKKMLLADPAGADK